MISLHYFLKCSAACSVCVHVLSTRGQSVLTVWMYFYSTVRKAFGAADLPNPDEKTVNAGKLTNYLYFHILIVATVVVWPKSSADAWAARVIVHCISALKSLYSNMFSWCLFPLSGLIVSVLGGIVLAGAVILLRLWCLCSKSKYQVMKFWQQKCPFAVIFPCWNFIFLRKYVKCFFSFIGKARKQSESQCQHLI